MNFWHLKVFNEIMVSGTISQAAKNLKRTQSSISAALSNLEKQIGYDLFVRKKRRLHPVPEAYFLKEESKSILQQSLSLLMETALVQDTVLETSQKMQMVMLPLLVTVAGTQQTECLE